MALFRTNVASSHHDRPVHIFGMAAGLICGVFILLLARPHSPPPSQQLAMLEPATPAVQQAIVAPAVPSLPTTPTPEEVAKRNPLYTPENKGKILGEFQGDPPHAGLWSKMANVGDLRTGWAKANAELAHIQPSLLRETWEVLYALETVKDGKKCVPGSKGLVFTRGSEPLVAALAKQGCAILAAPLPADGLNAEQHLGKLYKDWFGPREDFSKLVTSEALNLNFLNANKVGSHDFLISLTIQRSGSVSLGKRVILNAMEVLKPGGLAFFSTEFSLSNLQSSSQQHGKIAIWAMADVQSLASDLCYLGYEVLPLRFEVGIDPNDLRPDTMPYGKGPAHIKLWLYEEVVTNFVIIARKPNDYRPGKAPECHKLYALENKPT